MNGDTLTIIVPMIAVGVALFGTAIWHGTKLGNIQTKLKSFDGIWDHISDNEHRLTTIETEHKCCPVCNREGKGGE